MIWTGSSRTDTESFPLMLLSGSLRATGNLRTSCACAEPLRPLLQTCSEPCVASLTSSALKFAMAKGLYRESSDEPALWSDGRQSGHYSIFEFCPECRRLARNSNIRAGRDSHHRMSSMRTARPAAWPPHPIFEFRAHPFDMLPPCLIFLDGNGPADPLVAREWRYVFPGRQCLRVGRERLSEISRKAMYDPFGGSNGCHGVISQAKGSSI